VLASGKDQTYAIAANLIKKIAFNPDLPRTITPPSG